MVLPDTSNLNSSCPHQLSPLPGSNIPSHMCVQGCQRGLLTSFPGEEMHTVPMIYRYRQEGCLVPQVESCMQSWLRDALAVPREKPGARSGAATWTSIDSRPQCSPPRLLTVSCPCGSRWLPALSLRTREIQQERRSFSRAWPGRSRPKHADGPWTDGRPCDLPTTLGLADWEARGPLSCGWVLLGCCCCVNN